MWTDSISVGRASLFIDAAIQMLEERKVSSDMIDRLQNYIQNEEFETDTIYMDIEQNSNGNIIGNIADAMNNNTLMTLINGFIQNNRSYFQFMYFTTPIFLVSILNGISFELYNS